VGIPSAISQLFLSVKMNEAQYFETSVNAYLFKQRRIQEEEIHGPHRC
jgi:hypothetical protein